MPNHKREMGEKREYGERIRPTSVENHDKFLRRWAQDVRQECATAVGRQLRGRFKAQWESLDIGR